MIQFGKKATLRIEFEDGTHKDLDLGGMCSEINMSENNPFLKQSINLESVLKDGKPVENRMRLAYTKQLMDGKKWKEIRIFKSDA